ncbi:glutathione S-transferase family protein [Sandaracinobacteroides saxicola]|uniref:Glutathione S-transferase family protein n=1 Tax=Sandaracinobacteroides saxicola TaxID=2759707 RepID=A0A7G5IH62_9SPHN|nr:glutathione S-transferase family protein [Sandaracinobacteroides saxicola]QMW22704.1 glutathione S-transferase family protein [Sandaracinobacteroides saxicola]
MRFYDSVGPNPHVVRMVMAEKGLAIETVTLDILKGENRQAAHVARNPAGGTPALETDDGAVICEITAIAEYLEELHPEPPLIGRTAAERAEARMWMRRIDLYILEPMANGFRATEGRPLFAPRMTLVTPEAGAELKAIAAEKLLWLDGLMAGRTWVCGERFTLADILLFAFVQFGATVRQPIPTGASWLPGWRERVAARPSAGA